eukprot:GFUD01028215.1.p1 GENE.GFUD01028215.1~~GFUD01028215.1.p1  ORF type:complete len:1265 (+),score=407.13 GFUD01028215.1:55-3849(+)
MSQIFNLEPKVQIVVAFLSSRKLDATEMADDDDEDEEDDDDFDFSPTSLKTKLPSKRIVEMKILNTGAKVHVKCRLPWTWSWLQATLELRFPVTPRSSEAQQLIDGKFKAVQCHLDPSMGHNGVYAISLFLKDVKGNDLGDGDTGSNDGGGATYFTEYKTQFCNWLERQPPQTVRLALLEELLTKYEEEQQEARALQTGLFRQLMSRSVPGQVFYLATNQPTFFRAAPILFPKKIMSIMVFPEDGEQEIRKKQHLLDILEEVTKEEPWKFGFSDLMYKETKYSGLEAPYFAIKNAWFYSSFSDLHKTSLQTYDLFKQTCKSRGHTFLLQHDLPTHFHYYTRDPKRAKDGEETSVPNSGMMYSATEFLIENEILKREMKGAEERFHLMRYWKAEESICSSLESILLSPTWELDVDLTDPRFERIQADGAQMAAANCIISKAVTLVSGRGGTGKTEVVSAVLKAAEEGIKKEGAQDIKDDSLISEDGVNSEDSFMTRDRDTSVNGGGGIEEPPDPSNGPILYCAPTGKAASVIKKRVGSKAFTIHQILASYKLWRTGEQLNPWKFGATRVVAVDECSMVSIEIFQFLLKYLIEGARLSKIVLLGDHLQLPSVDPGNFMEDLFIALKPRGLTVNLQTNHRSEGSIIFSNASKISNQQMPIFDSSQGFSLIVPDNEKIHNLPPQVRTHAKKLAPPSAQPIQIVKGKGKEPDMDRMLLYWALLRQYKEQYTLVDDEKSQIISFLNNECTVLNQFGCFVYNKHLVWEGDGRKMRKQFHVGDKIICTKNSDIPIYVDEKEEKDEKAGEENGNKTKALEYTVATDGKYEEPPNLNLKSKNERLMNGNLYKIRAVCRGDVTSSGNAEDEAEAGDVGAASEGVKVSREYYVLDDLSGDIIRANPDMLVKKTKITHAWALSIHKFQGSEADTIVYGLSGSNYESWKHVYTAVTRGKKNVVIVGSYQDLEKAVKRKPIRRQTALTEKVRKLMGTVAKKKEEMKAAEAEKVILEGEKCSTSTVNQPKKDICKKKVLKKSKPANLESSLTPTKLSQIFSDSMRDWDTEDTLFEEVKAGRETDDLSGDSDNDVFSDTCPDPNITEDLISPSKRKATTYPTFLSPKQIKPIRTSSTHASRNLSQAWNLDESAFQGDLLRTKRPACDSPASYQSTCKFNSPLTYGGNRAQPQPGTPQWGEDSFSELNCSQMETEAIASSQQVEARKNMVDVFGSDESDDALDNLDEDSDDELVQAVKLSQLVTNREEMELNEVLALSQRIY